MGKDLGPMVRGILHVRGGVEDVAPVTVLQLTHGVCLSVGNGGVDVFFESHDAAVANLREWLAAVVAVANLQEWLDAVES